MLATRWCFLLRSFLSSINSCVPALTRHLRSLLLVCYYRALSHFLDRLFCFVPSLTYTLLISTAGHVCNTCLVDHTTYQDPKTIHDLSGQNTTEHLDNYDKTPSSEWQSDLDRMCLIPEDEPSAEAFQELYTLYTWSPYLTLARYLRKRHCRKIVR